MKSKKEVKNYQQRAVVHLEILKSVCSISEFRLQRLGDLASFESIPEARISLKGIPQQQEGRTKDFHEAD